MEYLKITNWDRWQSYRSDRNQPPWIKLHRCLLRNVEWVGLTDEQRGQLVSIWLLAADRKGEIPADPQILQKLCYLSKKPDMQLFINHGFIENGVKVTSNGRQGDVLDKTRLDKTRQERDARRAKAPSRFTPPSLREIKEFIKEMEYEQVNPVAFYSYYESNGWMVGRHKMKDWRAAARNWQYRTKQ
jgi:hypothetical protein